MHAPRALRRLRLQERRRSSARRDIQGLRAFAVVVVILNHLAGWPDGGYVGVDMFFVISGFLITGLLLREHERTGHISFTRFYRRRIKRIIPAAVLALAVTVAGAYLVFNTQRFHTTVVDAVWALFFAGNWRFAAQSTNYFSASGPVSPLQHFWSLGVEEQFYLVWPWLMLLTFVVLIRRNRSATSARTVVAGVLATITIGSFAWAMWESQNVPARAYFSTFSRAWELGVGAMLAVLAPALTALPAAARPVLAWLGVAGMVASLWLVGDLGAFPAPAAALPVLAVALVILAGTGAAEQRWLLPLTNPVTVYVGDISYSLYLWHFSVIVLGTALAGDDTLHRVIYGVTLTLTAIYSYHLVENPIRRSDWLTGQRRQRGHSWRLPEFSDAYKLTAVSLLALVTLTAVVASLMPHHPAAGVTVSLPSSTNDGGGGTRQATVPPKLHHLQKQIVTALAATSWPDNLNPSLDEVLSSPEAPPDVAPCGMAGPVDESKCSWGSPTAPHTAILVGSSIAMTYVAALREALPHDQWRVMSYGMFGCAWLDPSMVTNQLSDPEPCFTRVQDAVAAINRIKPDLVFVSGTAVAGIDTVKSSEDEWSKVTAPSKLVVLPGPPGDADLHSCYTKTSSPSDCVGTVDPAVASAGDRVFANHEGGVFVPSWPWFCVQGECPPFVGTTVTKMDGRHMTPAYALKIAPVIREALEQRGILSKKAG